MVPKATLCILTRHQPTSQVLLGYKKTGFGKGKYTGFGGKVEPGESVIAAARRELAEETGIHVPIKNLLPFGVLTFNFPSQPEWDQEVHVFRIDSWHGEPVESDEMEPVWFHVDELPYDRMWDDGRYWLPPVLAGKHYTACFTFREDNATVAKVEIAPVDQDLPTSPSPVPFSLRLLLASSLHARSELLAADPHHDSAVRLFNGFLEGCPELAAEVYADTLVLHNYADPAKKGLALAEETQAFYLDHLPWIKTVVVKSRGGDPRQASAKRGVITFGNIPARKIREHGVWYAINLLLHQDTTFYPDTRNLRRWAIDHLAGKRVLNTFAYTGSLGVAALAGGAQQVLQLDRNQTYLELAKSSYDLNGFSSSRGEFRLGDFFSQIGVLKKEGRLFGCIFLDPPFFSVTGKGRVDLVSQSNRLINKVRPLVANDGWLVTVNNALFLSGNDFLDMLERLCADGYLMIEELVSVPPDCAGYPETQIRALPVDPAPFNHATKIAVLRVQRK